MNLFQNFFIYALFYLLILYSTVVCRISDKRKCANADCSEPISLATTLLHYNADDDRLLSFPRNAKLKVYSKEAGDIPNFWEAQFNGRRGYVPKSFLREEKVLIPPSKLTHVVSTGKTENVVQNNTIPNSEEKVSAKESILSPTPELPVANSKGFLSTIVGVSADSVPMNSPDIKPQSTRKFQVVDGTTLYDDVVSEKPESPPTVIEDIATKTDENNVKPQTDPQEVARDSNEPSANLKPMNEVVNENEPVVESDKNVGQLTKEEGNLGEEKSNVVENKDDDSSEKSPVENNIIGTMIDTVGHFFSSGAGEDTGEEELEEEEDEDGEEEADEGSAEEEEIETEKEESEIEVKLEATISDKSEEEIQHEDKQHSTEKSQLNTSDVPSLANIVDKDFSVLKQSVSQNISNHETAQGEVTTVETNSADQGIKEPTEEPKETSNEIKTEAIEVSKTESSENIREVKDGIVNKTIEVDKHEPDLDQGPEFPHEESVKSPELETVTSSPNNILSQLSQENKIQDLPDVVTTEGDNSIKEMVISKPIKDPFNKASDSQSTGDSNEGKGEGQFKTDEYQFEEKSGFDDTQDQDQSKTHESYNQEQLETDKPHEQDQSRTDDPEVQGQPEITAGSPPVEQTTRQFLYTSIKSKEFRPEQDKHEISDIPSSTELQDDVQLEVESVNDTVQVENVQSHDSTLSPSTLQSSGSPKYSSVVSRRIQNSDSSADEISSHGEEEEVTMPQSDHINESTDSALIHGETLPPSLSPQSQSPKYSAVINQRMGFVPANEMVSETANEAEPGDAPTTEKEMADIPIVEILDQSEIKTEVEIETNEGILEENDVRPEDVPPQTPDADVPAAYEEIEASSEGVFSWFTSFFDVSRNQESNSPEELPTDSENFDSSQTSHIGEETCSTDGLEGSCSTVSDTMQKEVTWQESSYTSEMWELVDRVPLEATIWLIITAVVVLIFSLGHYYIEAHRRDGPLVAIINKLEREVLILKKEGCIFEDRLQIAQQQLEAWNTSSTENDALLIELKQELEETKAAKAELEEQAAQLKDELETVTESGLEMHRLLEESLSSQDGSQVLLSTVETLREKLQRQEEEISGLSDTLSSKNDEVEELQSRLVQAAEVARSLEDQVIAVTRGKEEELLQLRSKHRELINQLEEVMETKALDETRLSTEMSKLRLNIKELQKTLAEKDSELDTLKEVVKQLRATDSNEKIEALFDVVGVQARLRTAIVERDDFREKFMEEEGARKLLEGHMKKITQEVADLKNSFETAEKEKIEALTKLQVLSNYFKEKESQLQKELGLQESMWLQKQSDDHTIYEQMRSLREENEKYKLQNESLKKEIVEQEASFKIQLANTEQKAHENWVASRQAERRVKEAQQEAAQLRNRLTTVEKNTSSYSLDEKPNISESNGDPSSPPPSLMYPPTTSPPFMMYGPPIPPPGDFVPPPPFMGSPYPSDSRPPPLGRISSPPLDHRFSPPPPLSYPPYDYPPYGHHSPSPPPPFPPHHRNVHKPQPREMSREQKDHVPNYSPEAEKTSRRNKR